MNERLKAAADEADYRKTKILPPLVTKEKPGSSAYAMMEHDRLLRILSELLDELPISDVLVALAEAENIRRVWEEASND